MLVGGKKMYNDLSLTKINKSEYVNHFLKTFQTSILCVFLANDLGTI